MKNFMALDQYGNTFHDLGPRPRKTLLERLNRKRAEKTYQDTDTETFHVGYVIAGHWLDLYHVEPYRVKI